MNRNVPALVAAARFVSRKTEQRHKAGLGRSYLTAQVLAQNQSLTQHQVPNSGIPRKKYSCPPAKQQVIRHIAPVRRALLATKNKARNSAPGDEPMSDEVSRDAYDPLDFVMSEAGPSGVNNKPPDLSLPPPAPSISSGDTDEYGLSKLCCSGRILECVERVGRQ